MKNKEKAILVTVQLDFEKEAWDVLERELELEELAKSAGAEIFAQELCHRQKPSADLYVGEGKAGELAELARDVSADLIIFNNDLTGTQHRNLEKMIGARVVDRTQLILDIFARRARSPEGKAQVELAQLEYLLPRLSGKGAELSRLGGGIGTRGPGEQKLEEDRRRIRERILRLKKDLRSIESRRKNLRSKRDERSIPTVVLVGYTSAGKSTLFNALTQSEQAISCGLFTTLDPLSRAVVLPNHQKIVLSDTVGFISQLPHRLVEAFKATLEEVMDADLLIHVLDAHSPYRREHFEAVQGVLEELGIFGKKIILALNKIDLLEGQKFCEEFSSGVRISALQKLNFDRLLLSVQEALAEHVKELRLLLPISRMDLVDSLYREGKVLEIAYEDRGIRVRALLPVILADQLKSYQASS